jgi:hypothetical protein
MPDFIAEGTESESWRWWKTLSIETQYSLMRISRRSDDLLPPNLLSWNPIQRGGGW